MEIPRNNPTNGRISAGIGWMLLLLSSLLGILVLEYLQPRIVLALQRAGEVAGVPAGFNLLLGGYRFLWLLPIIAAALGMFCLKWGFFRQIWLVAATAAMFLVAYIFVLVLMSFHFLGINASYAGGRLENRLPESGAAIASNLTSVVAYQLTAANDHSKPVLFRGHSVSSQVEFSGSGALRTVNALLDDIHASDGRAAMCFLPRHGLSIRSEGGQLDLLICFECRKLEYWVDGENDRLGIMTNSLAVFEDLLAPGSDEMPAVSNP